MNTSVWWVVGFDGDLLGNENRLMARLPVLESSGRWAIARQANWSETDAASLTWLGNHEAAASVATVFGAEFRSAAVPGELVVVVGPSYLADLGTLDQGLEFAGWHPLIHGGRYRLMTENDYVELLSRVATRATGIFDEELRGCLDKRRQEFTRAHAALHVLRGNGAVQAPDYVIRKLALTAVQRDLVYEEDRGLASARLGLNTTDIRNEVARYIARVASHGEEKDIKASYNDVWLAAPSLGVRVTDLKEVGGKLYVTATAQYAYDKDRLWEAIKKHADWEKNLVADITVANTDVFGYHVVKSGDTLRKIAQLAYGDAHAVKRIVEANRNILKDPKHIKPGQRLKIPR